MDQIYDLTEKNFSIFSKTAVIKGDVCAEGDFRFAGQLEGKLENKNGCLVIERTAFVSGEVKADKLEIFGTVQGSIECDGNIVIFPSAVIEGTIKAKTLTIFPGAIVNIEGHTTLTIN